MPDGKRGNTWLNRQRLNFQTVPVNARRDSNIRAARANHVGLLPETAHNHSYL